MSVCLPASLDQILNGEIWQRRTQATCQLGDKIPKRPGVAIKGSLARKEMVQHQAKRVDICCFGISDCTFRSELAYDFGRLPKQVP